jgi:hypothetical protein
MERSVEAYEDASAAKRFRAAAYQSAELIRRTLAVDVLACVRCDGRLRRALGFRPLVGRGELPLECEVEEQVHRAIYPAHH